MQMGRPQPGLLAALSQGVLWVLAGMDAPQPARLSGGGVLGAEP